MTAWRLFKARVTWARPECAAGHARKYVFKPTSVLASALRLIFSILLAKIPIGDPNSLEGPVANYSAYDSTFYLSASCKMIREYP
ncbi:hypothetical protein [Rhizobium leguminosarum]